MCRYSRPSDPGVPPIKATPLAMPAPLDPVNETPRGIVRHYWSVVDGRWWHVATPLVLITLANAAEGLSLALIIPLTEAFSGDVFASLDNSWALGWMTGTIPDAIVDPALRQAWLLGLLFGMLILGRVVMLAFEYAAELYAAKRRERYRVLIGQETFGRVLSFGRQYFDRHALGSVVTEVNWSFSLLSLLEAAEGLFRSVLAIAVKGAIMVVLSVPLLISFAIVVPLVQWGVNSINQAVRRISQEGLDVERGIRAQMIDILGSVSLVKAFSMETAMSDQYGRALRGMENVAVDRARWIGLRQPVEEVAILGSMLLVQVIMVVAAGEFSLAQIAVFGGFLVVLHQSLVSFKLIGRDWLTFMEHLPKVDALAALFSDQGKFIVPSGERPFEGLTEGIAVSQLGFRYQDGTRVLQDIDAFIPAGRVTAIVGPSGSGKSTLVELIARQYDCPAGSILLDGVDIREFSLPTLHRAMTLVSQSVSLLNVSLRDNLVFGMDRAVTDAELESALSEVELGTMLADLPAGLDTEIGDHGVRLSGGQRQRVAIARALLRDPDILILDEATSALDSEVETRVAQTIQRRAVGRTLIVIAHRLSTIRDADQILVIEDGSLVEQGTWNELLARGETFARLHAAQFEGENGG